MLATLTLLAFKVSASPDPAGLPGSGVAGRLVNGIFFYTLLGCLAGLLVSVMAWVFASRAHNVHHAQLGRQGIVISGAGAIIAGAAPALISFFSGLGQSVH